MGHTEQPHVVKKDEENWRSRIHDLIEASYTTRIKSVNESIEIINQAKTLSQIHGYSEGLDIADTYYAFYLMIKGDFQHALSISTEVLRKFKKSNQKKYKSLALYTIGSVYYKSNNYHIGLQHLLDCLSIRKEIDDKLGQSQVLKAIGSIYEFFNDYESAEEMYERSIAISKEINDKLGQSNACNPLSGIYLKRNKINEALTVAEESIRLKKSVGDERGLAFAYHAKGKVFFRRKNFKEAEAWFFKSIDLHLKAGEKLGIGLVSTKLAEMYYLAGQYDKAKEELKRAIGIAEPLDNKLVLHKSYHISYQIEKAEKNDSKALMYLEKHLENKESVINTDTSSIVKSLKAMSHIEILEREKEVIKEKNKAIKKKNTELDTFVYRVSHDLRGPIASLLGLYNIAKYDIKDKVATKYLELYHEQILRLNSIILDLINLTRIKGWQSKTDNIDFKNIIDNIIESFKYVPNFADIDFKIHIDNNIDYTSDKSIMTTIFQNLIENSIKYSRIDVIPFIEIQVLKDEDNKKLQIKVIDNGIGIDLEYQEKIFEMFFRANDEKDGSGLGLYILKYAVDKLNGSINLSSKHGQGSKFSITLPLNPK